MTQFDAYAAYYDLVYKAKDYVSEAQYVLALAQKHGVKPTNILEFGAGTGGHAKAFASLESLRITCIELSEKMIAMSGESSNTEFYHGDARWYRCNRTFDLVVSIFHVLSYQRTNDDVLSFFQNASIHLPVGGCFIADYWYAPAVLTQGPESRTKTFSTETLSVRKDAKPIVHHNENIVEVQYRISMYETPGGRATSFEENHAMRYFSLPEIRLFASCQGFELVHSSELITANAPSIDTWAIISVFKKVRDA